MPASVMTTPPYECPTRIDGPAWASSACFVVATSPSRLMVGFCTTVTVWPSLVSRSYTCCQPEPSTKPPWTSTMWGPVVGMADLLWRGRPPVYDESIVRRLSHVTGLATGDPLAPADASGDPVPALGSRLSALRSRLRIAHEVLESVPERGARRDTELRKDLVEVRADRAVGQEQPLADLLVRQAFGRELGDLKLLGR